MFTTGPIYSLSLPSQEFIRQGVDTSGMDKMALWKDQDPGRIGDIIAVVSLGLRPTQQKLNGN